MVVVCSGCTNRSDPVPDAMRPLGRPAVYCDSTTPTPIAEGFLVGADSDRVFIRSGELYSWPKTGGPLELFARQDVGRLTVSGARYYWWSAEQRIIVTDRDGATLADVTLDGPQTIAELATAPDEAVYIRTSVNTILRLDAGASTPSVLVSSPNAIAAMASDADALVWLERTSASEATIHTWSATAGQRTVVAGVTGIVHDMQPMALRAGPDGGDVFYGRYDTIEQRSLQSGDVVGTYSDAYASYLRVVGDSLYFTEPKSPLLGPWCDTLRGLTRRPLDASYGTPIDTSAFEAPYVVDDSRIYYERGVPQCCWGQGMISCPQPPREVSCATL